MNKSKLILRPIVWEGLLELVSKLSKFRVTGYSVFWVFVRYPEPNPKHGWWKNRRWHRLVNHESIHFYQQVELLFIIFFIMYGLSYLYNRVVKKLKHKAAYRDIIFEREAYDNDDDLFYLNKRKLYACFRK